MLAKSLLVVASAALAFASPIVERGEKSCRSRFDPPLPQTGGAQELPSPASGLKLKYIALGLGIQNYSCASINATAASTGALAMLYDITHLYPGNGHKSLSLDGFDNLSAYAVNNHSIPLNFNSSTAGRVDSSALGASLADPFPPNAPLKLQGYESMPFLGHHFFNAAGAPNFVLHNAAVDVVATKNASVPAPASANPGPMGTGAVTWLGLSANPGSRGAKYVYRLLTAGGDSHGCTKAAGRDSTSYAALYWFYD